MPEYLRLKSFIGPIGELRHHFFIKNKFHHIPDAVLGWKFKANTKKGKLEFDEYSSRTFGVVDWNSFENKGLLLGDSLISGHDRVNNQETINAYLDTENLKFMNMGIDLFELDQVYLLLKKMTNKFHFKNIVIAVNSDTGKYLRTSFVPYTKGKHFGSMPYLKPRFYIENGVLKHFKINLKNYNYLFQDKFVNNLNKVGDKDDLLKYKSYIEDSYAPFDKLLKIKLKQGSIYDKVKQVYNSLKYNNNDKSRKLSNADLLSKLVDKINVEFGDKVIFLIIPRQENTVEQIEKRKQLLSILNKGKSRVIDTSPKFLSQNKNDIFFGDGHLKPFANKAISTLIKAQLD